MAARSTSKKPKQLRDPEATKQALIDAGEKVFARHGFVGATLDLLSEASGVNKALISYYFGSKEGLYDAVISALAEDTLANVRALYDETSDPAKNLRNYIRALAHAFAARPTYGAIIMREYISGEMQEREGPFRDVFQFFRMTEKIYNAGKKTGAFRKVDPHQLHLSIIAPLVHFTLTQGFRERALKKYASDVENPDVETFSRHHERMILEGLIARPSRGRGKPS